MSGSRDDADIPEGLRAGAADFVPKADLWRRAVTARRLADSRRFQISFDKLERQNWGMKRLVMAVQDLSLARTLDEVMALVRKAARELTGADGAGFVLRDGERCFYADEDAIAPLWKGQRFPMTACISRWTMLNRQTAIIEDI